MMTTPLIRRLTAGTMALTASAAIGGAIATPASAATDGSTVAVCANSLFLRTTPAPDGPYDGTLKRDDNVHVYSHSGKGMVHVHAYGQIHRDGYVLESGLC